MVQDGTLNIPYALYPLQAAAAEVQAAKDKETEAAAAKDDKLPSPGLAERLNTLLDKLLAAVPALEAVRPQLEGVVDVITGSQYATYAAVGLPALLLLLGLISAFKKKVPSPLPPRLPCRGRNCQF